MQKVKSNWISPKEKNEKEYDDFDEMLEQEEFIGFIPAATDSSERFMIVTDGDYAGVAIRFDGNWIKSFAQKKEKGSYFIFDTYSELLDWMKG